MVEDLRGLWLTGRLLVSGCLGESKGAIILLARGKQPARLLRRWLGGDDQAVCAQRGTSVESPSTKLKLQGQKQAGQHNSITG